MQISKNMRICHNPTHLPSLPWKRIDDRLDWRLRLTRLYKGLYQNEKKKVILASKTGWFWFFIEVLSLLSNVFQSKFVHEIIINLTCRHSYFSSRPSLAAARTIRTLLKHLLRINAPHFVWLDYFAPFLPSQMTFTRRSLVPCLWDDQGWTYSLLHPIQVPILPR